MRRPIYIAYLILGVLGSPSTVEEEWRGILSDQLLPWSHSGINKKMIQDTFNFRGSHIMFQHLNGSLYIHDPNRYCFCNNSIYSPNPKDFLSHLKFCRAVESVIRASITEKKLPDFELVWSLDDIPTWYSQNGISDINDTNVRKTGIFYPGFGAIRCWSKGGLTLPAQGSNKPWHLDTYEDEWKFKENPFDLKQSRLVFRGSKRGCSFERDTLIDFPHEELDFNWTESGCGRDLFFQVAFTAGSLLNDTPP